MKCFLKWIYEWGSPRVFHKRVRKVETFLVAPAYISVLLGAVWGLAIAPADYLQGEVYRIIYIHVPMAFLAQSFYFAMAISAFVFLIWRIKIADLVMSTLAPLGLCFTCLSLVTGSIWGKPTWGTYWVWDARLTSMLVLAFLYLGVIFLRSMSSDYNRAGKLCAILSLVGVVNLPIIKYSVEWWNTLHQPASITLTNAPTMPSEMWIPLFFNIAAYYLMAFHLTLWSMRVIVVHREIKSSWVQRLALD